MTATQAPPASTDPAPTEGARSSGAGDLASILGTTDHKVIGRLFIGTGLLYGLASAVAGLLAGIDRIDGVIGNTILNLENANQVISFSTTGLTLLTLMPALLGLAMVVVPLQVGARAIAFPRAAAASYWGFLMGAALVIAAYAMNGGPGGGRADGVELWFASLGLAVGSILLGSICVATTILAARVEGMDLGRVPLFTWSMLCTTVLWLLTMPVLGALLIVMYLDFHYGQVFIETGPVAGAYFDWLRRTPQVYAVAIPVLGLLLDTAATASSARIRHRGLARGAIGGFAILSIGAFALPALSPDAAAQPVTKGMSLLAPVPVVIVLVLAGLTVRSGKARVTSGFVGSAVAALVLLVATIMGLFTPFQSLFELEGTLWVAAQAHLTLAASAIAIVAGLYHWATKIGGRAANEALGRTAPVLLGVGALVVGIAEAASGLLGSGSEAGIGIEGLNVVAIVGAALVLIGALLAVAGLVGRGRDDETGDPWGGQSLEWATASPPSFANFDGDIPAVSSPEPLMAESSDSGGGA